MMIGSIGGTDALGINGGVQPGAANTASDPVSKNIQKQIEYNQKKLQDLAADEKISPEEKIKKKQEIQQEIAGLTQQLRQHQMEQKREQRQSKGTSTEDMLGMSKASAKASDNDTGLSQAGMQAILTAGASIKQADIQGSVASGLKGEANVLRSEIKTDAARGSSTEKKQQELAEVEGKAQAAVTSQAYSLGRANAAAKEAAKAEKEDKAGSDTSRTEKEDDQKRQSEKAGGTDQKTDKASDQEADGTVPDADAKAAAHTQQSRQKSAQVVSASVDIRL